MRNQITLLFLFIIVPFISMGQASLKIEGVENFPPSISANQAFDIEIILNNRSNKPFAGEVELSFTLDEQLIHKELVYVKIDGKETQTLELKNITMKAETLSDGVNIVIIWPSFHDKGRKKEGDRFIIYTENSDVHITPDNW